MAHQSSYLTQIERRWYHFQFTFVCTNKLYVQQKRQQAMSDISYDSTHLSNKWLSKALCENPEFRARNRNEGFQIESTAFFLS